MNQIEVHRMKSSISTWSASVIIILLLCACLFAGEGEVKKSDPPKASTSASGPGVKTAMIKMDGAGGGVPWLDLAAIIEDAKGGVRVADTIALPEDLPRAASLEKGALIKSFQNKPVTSAADMMAQYDKLKTGDTVSLTFESKGKTGAIKFVKPKSAGNCVMIKK